MFITKATRRKGGICWSRNDLLHASCCTVEKHQFHLNNGSLQTHDPLDKLTSVTSPEDMVVLKQIDFYYKNARYS